MKPIYDKNAQILYNQLLTPGYYRMGIKSRQIARQARPGQFLQIKCGSGYDPLLRRPLSVHRLVPESDTIEILYRLRGKGTRILANKRPGEMLNLIGPLGNSFSLTSKVKNAVLVGGGMGVAPLLFLAQKLKQTLLCNQTMKDRQLYVIIGASTREGVLCENDFKAFSREVGVATEDGSYGLKGMATELLDSLLKVLAGRETAVYACGPKPMLKEISKLAVKHNLLKCQVCMEEYMACGMGVCRSCAVKVKPTGSNGPNSSNSSERFVYKMVCSDGPVFEAEEILW